MDDLLTEIEKHLEETKTAASVFGREAMGDPSFVFELRKGRDYRRNTAEKVMNFIRSQQAEGAT